MQPTQLSIDPTFCRHVFRAAAFPNRLESRWTSAVQQRSGLNLREKLRKSSNFVGSDSPHDIARGQISEIVLSQNTNNLTGTVDGPFVKVIHSCRF
mmetsp:Transcript_18093/g.34319  ORF Transcript_18093/g.34319 Transcript_18093/m.34319 type:complete len:96 (+) Transcript_18093:616-903(+)